MSRRTSYDLLREAMPGYAADATRLGAAIMQRALTDPTCGIGLDALVHDSMADTVLMRITNPGEIAKHRQADPQHKDMVVRIDTPVEGGRLHVRLARGEAKAHLYGLPRGTRLQITDYLGSGLHNFNQLLLTPGLHFLPARSDSASEACVLVSTVTADSRPDKRLYDLSVDAPHVTQHDYAAAIGPRLSAQAREALAKAENRHALTTQYIDTVLGALRQVA